jgi:hypothetical protein
MHASHDVALRRVLASGAVDSWTLLISALGVAIVLEGLPYFVAPSAMRRYLELLSRMSDRALRTLGFGLMVAGLLVAYSSLH